MTALSSDTQEIGIWMSLTADLYVFGREKKSLVLHGNRKPDRPARSRVTSDYAIMASFNVTDQRSRPCIGDFPKLHGQF